MTKFPVAKFEMAMLMVKGWFAGTVSPFLGFSNFAEGILLEDGMTPMGAGLHEPPVICWPLVMGKFGTVKQKLMKLLVDVSEAT